MAVVRIEKNIFEFSKYKHRKKQVVSYLDRDKKDIYTYSTEITSHENNKRFETQTVIEAKIENIENGNVSKFFVK